MKKKVIWDKYLSDEFTRICPYCGGETKRYISFYTNPETGGEVKNKMQKCTCCGIIFAETSTIKVRKKKGSKPSQKISVKEFCKNIDNESINLS